MGNNSFCSCKNDQGHTNNEIQNDIVYTDSTYNIWDNNPVRSQTSFSSQLTFSLTMNNKVSSFQKEQYLTTTSPRNGNQSSSSNGFQTDKLTNSQINMKLEMLQEIMKKQNSIINEETEVDTIVDLPKESYRHIDQKVAPSGFSQRKMQDDGNQSRLISSQIYQSDINSVRDDQMQSKLSQQFNQSQQGRIDTQATEQERLQTVPLYSLKYIKNDNTIYDDEKMPSQQFNEPSQLDNNKIQNHSSKQILYN